nr:hypothetical protein [Hylemonella gracilis]
MRDQGRFHRIRVFITRPVQHLARDQSGLAIRQGNGHRGRRDVHVAVQRLKLEVIEGAIVHFLGEGDRGIAKERRVGIAGEVGTQELETRAIGVLVVDVGRVHVARNLEALEASGLPRIFHRLGLDDGAVDVLHLVGRQTHAILLGGDLSPRRKAECERGDLSEDGAVVDSHRLLLV